jgi:hypothetical protein
MTTYTLTFGDCAENHVGMQKIGELCEEGYSIEDLKHIRKNFKKLGFECEMYNLSALLAEVDDFEEEDDAAFLVIKNGLSFFGPVKDFFDEQEELIYDSRAFMYGRVVNKHARHNLCFNDESQEPDYESKKGRIIAYDDVPMLKNLKEKLPEMFGPKAENMVVEANKYFDKVNCGIGFHGDAERMRVVGVRIGDTIPFVFNWYKKGNAIGEKLLLELEGGDMYVMSSKATGHDWKKKNTFTLRHAAGAPKFINNQ